MLYHSMLDLNSGHFRRTSNKISNSSFAVLNSFELFLFLGGGGGDPSFSIRGSSFSITGSSFSITGSSVSITMSSFSFSF